MENETSRVKTVFTEGLSEPQQMRGSPSEGAGCPDIGAVKSSGVRRAPAQLCGPAPGVKPTEGRKASGRV